MSPSERTPPGPEPPARPPVRRDAGRAPPARDPARPARGDLAFDVATRVPTATPGAAREQGADAAAAHVAQRPARAAPAGAPAAGPQPLPATVRADMEERFGVDLSAVRITTGADAPRRLGARAFALGASITFAPGEYAPDTPEGRRLLAHELAHVVQQWRDGRAALELQGSKPIADRVLDLVAKLGGAKHPLEPALVEEAVTLAKEVAASLTAAKVAAATGGGTDPVDDARDHLARILRALANGGADEAVIALVLEIDDPVVRSVAVNAIRGKGRGVAGQQAVLPLMSKLAKTKVRPPKRGETSQQWLDANTDAIGQTFKAFETMGLKGYRGDPLWLDLTAELLREYFHQSKANVTPEPTGKVAALPLEPQSKQIEADCDVYATYGARVLRAQGWSTAGYLAIVPEEKKADDPAQDRDAHAVALAKRPNPSGKGDPEYLGVGNWDIRPFGTSADEDAVVRGKLLSLALDVYGPPLKMFKAYYLPATAGGGFDPKLLDPKKHGLTAL